MVNKKKRTEKSNLKNIPTLKLKSEHEIAMDFATKAYKKFEKAIKSIILFGSTAKKTQTVGSDIDIIIVIDDASIKWDQELTAWYRQELDAILRTNPYQTSLHINTVKLTTWWQDLMRGDPIILNILRNGEALVDMAGFFDPLKFLLIQGKIKSTPEAIYNNLQRAPAHLARSKAAELNAIEGLYWCMVDSAHAALISANVSPPSPEHIPEELARNFVNNKKLKIEYVQWYRELLALHKEISHGKITDLKGADIDLWQKRAEEFLSTMAKLIKESVK
ncbi:MAG: Nucleotidyltransferase protein [archaeon GW2011_AR19]|nr:MAG: Nucleotidyltransferase protein [archaeon GW2011_AR19]